MAPPQRSRNVPIPSTSKPLPKPTVASAKRKPTEQQIKDNLALLASIPRPLPPTLPPSPPASRHNSPAPQKRKREPDLEESGKLAPSTSKRPRVDAAPGATTSTLGSALLTPSSSYQGSSAGSPTNVPDVKPPARKKRVLTPDQLRSLSDEIAAHALALKRSADSRRDFMNNGEPKSDSVRARETFLHIMELTDSVVHWLYSFWALDDAGKHVNNTRWASLPLLLMQCEQVWKWSAKTNEKDRVMAGLLGLILGLSGDRAAMESLRLSVDKAISSNPSPPPNLPSAAPNPQPTQVPSPSSSSASPSSTATESNLSSKYSNLPPRFLDTMINSARNAQISDNRISEAYSELSLGTLARLFPKTFGTCIRSEISAKDTHDVDLYACQKGNGVWAWPVLGSDAIPHLTGFASSLLWEYGELNGGYKGRHGCGQKY